MERAQKRSRQLNFDPLMLSEYEQHVQKPPSEYLNINKYLEGFPGLVHFIYVDRVNHRIIAPSYDFEVTKSEGNLTKNQVWSMVNLSQTHLQEGHLAIMWRDQSFCYAYYLWFEDLSGTPLQPKVSVPQAVKMLPLPGVISTDFYRRLIEICFPRMTHSKIRCFELYCIHLGVATSSCVLEHSHRLASTICEVSGKIRSRDGTVSTKVLCCANYRFDSMTENFRSIVKKGRSDSLENLPEIHTSLALTEEKKRDVIHLLKSHFGADWRDQPNLTWYANVLENAADPITEEDEECDCLEEEPQCIHI
ncbi:hypothetical protein GE061_006742 [Apolygus lucorum]|uniref:FUZ/MON1/HPS1 third Longin domain-containing protein n=1 Tax=Apolygus lucorum TaxID=248454 RepID=A0A8S9WW43_APOLU|nr:hypothetical protein GE061_006742 [Apolygus lucorum]